MFDCCRVPGPQGLDWSVSYAKQDDSGDSGHIVVFRKNRVWKVDVTNNGQILSTNDIEKYVIYTSDNTHKRRTSMCIGKFNIFMIIPRMNIQALASCRLLIVTYGLELASFYFTTLASD